AALGRIIERVTGMSYEEYVRTNVLAPMGISRMRIGQSLPQGRLPGEVEYASAGFTASIFPDFAGTVPWAYGGWCLEAMDAHGGWVASAVDYAKFLNAIEGRRGPRFLSAESVAAMTARPAIPDWAQSSYWYGFGLLVRPAGNTVNWWHSGSLDGTATYQVRTANGFDWVVFFNSRPGTAAGQNSLFGDIDAGLWNAYQQVSRWPAGDQFAGYPDSDPAGAAALPAITTREGVVNAATQDRGMVSGSWVLLRGVNLSQTTRTWSPSDIVNGALPTSLDGVSVRINGQPAFVYFISPGAIEAQAPAGLSPGWVTVEAVNHGVSTGPVLAHAVESAPGAFTYSGGEGRTLAVATEPDGTLVGDAAGSAEVRRAAPGDTITIYASGLMPSAAGMLAPACPRLGAIEVTIGGQTALETAATLAAPGLFQIHAVVPRIPEGDQPLVIRTGAAESPAGVTIAVGRSRRSESHFPSQ
ncbi:MAG TPA: serine hydrolase, partial [Bryobacteraceae bacterium]|nr:serine hydrolase [Bryobacteraceae bacterium]